MDSMPFDILANHIATRVNPHALAVVNRDFHSAITKTKWHKRYNHKSIEASMARADNMLYECSDFHNLFHETCSVGNLTSVKYALERSTASGLPCPTKKTYNGCYGGYPAISSAAIYGHLHVIEYLVAHGADVTIDNNEAVQLASEYGHLHVVKYLVSLGADIDNNCVIRYAAQSGHLHIVKYLVSLGVDITACGNDAVRWAAANGHLDVVKYLVSLDADIIYDVYIDLDDVARGGHLNMIKYLFQINPNMDIDYVLACAAIGPNIDLVKYLLAKGADVAYEDYRAVRRALKYNCMDIFELLLPYVRNSYA